ncbi:hypothetical protein D3C72_624470 [compost metagenome]
MEAGTWSMRKVPSALAIATRLVPGTYTSAPEKSVTPPAVTVPVIAPVGVSSMSTVEPASTRRVRLRSVRPKARTTTL